MQVTDFMMQPQSQEPSKPPVKVAVVDYQFGNVRSVMNALAAVGGQVTLSRDEADLQDTDCIILPGVGAFGDGMANLKQFGLILLLEELVLRQKKPFLGICVGMQLLAKKGYEGGEHDGLGWIDAEVARLDVDQTHALKVPHVGWHDVRITQENPLLGKPGEMRSYYFVHSYALQCTDPALAIGMCHYGAEFPAAIQQENIFAVQFHPEKSQKHGLNLLKNFLDFARPAETTC